MKNHLQQPSIKDIEEIGGLVDLTDEQCEGLKIAAFICRMYGQGDAFAEAIESHGEQQRARYWMKKLNAAR